MRTRAGYDLLQEHPDLWREVICVESEAHEQGRRISFRFRVAFWSLAVVATVLTVALVLR